MMKNFKAATMLSGNMSFLDRVIQIGKGLALVFGNFAIITSIAGWNLFYTGIRDIMSRKWRTKPYTYLARRRYT